MSEKIKTHKDLRVWQEIMDVAMEDFALSRRFPKDEMYSLTDQIRRSSRSVSANTVGQSRPPPIENEWTG